MTAIELLLLVGLIAACPLGFWAGWLFADERHQCPPRIDVDDLFTMQEREWENRGTKRYDIITVRPPGRHREEEK